MSESIQFCATVDSVAGGDDEVRLVLSVKDSAGDLAAAVQMLGKLNRVLQVEAYLGSDSLASFRGSIPPIKTAVQFRSNKPPVIKLDIPASDALSALRLIGYSERVIRFEVEDEGEKPKKAKKPKVKTPYGDMWQELLHRNLGFQYIPSVADALEDVQESPAEDAHALMRKVFGVESLSMSVGPDQIYAKFPSDEYKQIKGVVEAALRRAGEKK